MDGWERLWRRDEVAAAWVEADPRIVRLAQENAARRAWDLGCGVGRHATALAAAGLEVVGSDVSPTALLRCRAALNARGLNGSLVVAGMVDAPFADASFDLVVAYHVLYHGTANCVAGAIGEMRRALRPGGYAYLTLISANDSKCARFQRLVEAGEAEQLEPYTFWRPDRTESDDYLPHHFTAEAELRDRFLAGFDVVELDERRYEAVDPEEDRRQRAHWHMILRKPQPA
jgi:tellurite methyltransferase